MKQNDIPELKELLQMRYVSAIASAGGIASYTSRIFKAQMIFPKWKLSEDLSSAVFQVQGNISWLPHMLINLRQQDCFAVCEFGLLVSYEEKELTIMDRKYYDFMLDAELSFYVNNSLIATYSLAQLAFASSLARSIVFNGSLPVVDLFPYIILMGSKNSYFKLSHPTFDFKKCDLFLCVNGFTLKDSTIIT